jgi:carbon storage regulator
MLVLSRKLNQSIDVAGEIRITVLGLNGRRVKLGITALDDVAVRRGELAPQTQNRPGHHHEARPVAASTASTPASAASA